MEKRILNLKDSAMALLLAFILSQLFIILGEFIISAILAIFDYSQTQITNFFNSALGYMLTSLLQLSAFVSIYIYYCKKTTLKKESFANKLNIKQVIFFVVIGVVTSFALTNFINYYCLTLNIFNKPSSLFSYELNSVSSYLLSLISLALVPAIGEELLFRGVIFNGLKQKGTLFAVIVSSLFFTLFHFNLSQLFYPFLFGLILGFVYGKTKNLLVPMLIHFVNNILNISIQYFFGTSTFKPTTLNLVIMILGIIIYIGIISYFFFSSFKQENKENTENKENKQEQDKKETSNKIQPKKTNLINRDTLAFWIPIIFMIFIYIIIV